MQHIDSSYVIQALITRCDSLVNLEAWLRSCSGHVRGEMAAKASQTSEQARLHR